MVDYLTKLLKSYSLKNYSRGLVKSLLEVQLLFIRNNLKALKFNKSEIPKGVYKSFIYPSQIDAIEQLINKLKVTINCFNTENICRDKLDIKNRVQLIKKDVVQFENSYVY